MLPGHKSSSAEAAQTRSRRCTVRARRQLFLLLSVALFLLALVVAQSAASLAVAADVAPQIEGLRLTGRDASGLGGGLDSGQDAGGGVYILDTEATLTDIDLQPRSYGVPDLAADEYWPPGELTFIYL